MKLVLDDFWAGLEQQGSCEVWVRVRIRVRAKVAVTARREIFENMNDLGSNSVTVFVTSRRYRLPLRVVVVVRVRSTLWRKLGLGLGSGSR